MVAGMIEEAEEGDATTINHEGMRTVLVFFAKMYAVEVIWRR
jgi:hypothetical protein